MFIFNSLEERKVIYSPSD